MNLPTRAILICLFLGANLARATSFPPRPFLLLNEKELSALRQDLAQPGWKSRLYHAERGFSVLSAGQGTRANADLWLNRAIEIPGHGGHFHNFFCVDGERLAIPPNQQFAPGPYRCPKCGKVYSGEQYEAAVRRLVHGWLAQAALDLALVSALEQKPEYARKSAEILLKYADAYPGPHTSHTSGGMIFQSLDESMWVIPLAQAYDLVHDHLTKTERTKIETFLKTVAQGIQICGTNGNWGSWHLGAVGVIGYATENEPLIAWATERFQQQIRDQLGDDGLWPESVHTYHFFPLQAFVFFAEASWHCGVDLYHWEGKPGKSLLCMFTAPLEYAYPNLRLPAINDGWFQAFVPADLYEAAYHRTQDPRFAWVLAHGYNADAVPAGTVSSDRHQGLRTGFYALLFGGDISTHLTPPAFASINFPVLGICILRSTNGAMMSFDYGPFLGHGQRDKMGITLFAKNKLWLADYGTPGYGAAILPWYQSTFAHNTIVVDGKNQQPTKENNVRLSLGGANTESAQSETREAYPGVTHTRTVTRLGDCFVIMDELTSKAEHAYDFYLHGEGELQLDDGGRAAVAMTAPVPWIEATSAYPSQSVVSGRWTDHHSGVAFWMSGSGPLTPIVGQCPAETGARKIPLLISRQRARSARFVAVLFPYQGKLDFNVTPQTNGWQIKHDGVTNSFAWPGK